MALGKYKLALRDYERVCKVRPNDKDAKLKFTECRKIVQQIAFNKAISVEEKAASTAESIDVESMQVELYFLITYKKVPAPVVAKEDNIFR